MQKRAGPSCKVKVDEQLDDLVLILCHRWLLGCCASRGCNAAAV